jgi:Metallo-peptidase family M12/Fibronectin type III domain/Secretion system C-terminal sorting domain/Reprolysin family propeptide
MLFSPYRLALWCLCCILFAAQIEGQTITPQQQTLQQFEPINTIVPVEYAPFTIVHVQNELIRQSVKNAQLLTLNDAVTSQLLRERPADLDMKVPFNGDILTLRLSAAEVVTPDFTVLTDRSVTPVDTYLPGVHYKGYLTDDPESSVAFSVTESGMMGLIFSDDRGDIVLGKLEDGRNKNQYIVYSTTDLAVSNPFSCGVDESLDGPDKEPEAYSSMAEVSKCVRTYLECDNELFLEKGSSVQATVDYLLGMYNQVATLYQNEQITTIVSQMFIWTTADPYSTSSSASALNDFRALRTSFNGDLAHLVGSGGNNLGGIAYVDVLCSSYNYAFSDITGSYNTVPTYSWTVEVVTHEMGHNLGSNHTQWCGWQGGPIDNCVSPEGSCSPGPSPSNGGTIMSYCHLTGVGINFNNGFGPQPGNKIRVETTAASCVAASCPSTSCAAPSNLSITNITGSGATISWTAAGGASSATLRYRSVGASQWTTITSASSPYTISGLPANDEIEVTIQSVCGSAVSDYRTGVLFKTGASGGSGGGGTTCTAPGSISAAPSTNSANITWSAASGASGYQIAWKTNTSSTWSSPVSVSSTNYTINNLVASTTYNVRVSTVCSNGNSSFTTTTFVTTGSGTTCGTPGNLTANAGSTTASLSWSTVSGATAYQVAWKTSATTTWNSPVSVSSTSYSITGLSTSTGYNVRVNAVCANGNSNYGTTNFTTTSGGSGGSCGTPTNLVATPGASTVALTWTGVSGATNYRVQWKRTTTSSWGVPQTVTGTSATISGLFSSTAYNVRVAALCGTVVSSYITTTFTTTSSGGGGGTTCNAPTNFTAAPAINSATLNWSAATSANSYTVQWKTASSSTWSGQVVITGSTYTIPNLIASTAYNTRISSNCSSGASAFTTINFTTNSNSNGGTTCSTPTNLTNPVINSTMAAVSWQPVSGALNYNLQFKKATSSFWYNFSGLGATYINVQNLQSGTTYQFRVQTNCSGGITSAYSDIVSFTTLSALPEGNGLSHVNDIHTHTGAFQQLTLAPNPTVDFTEVQLSEGFESVAQLRVTNHIGRVVKLIQVGVQERNVSIDLQGLPSGVYQIQAVYEGVVGQPVRIVKM